MKDLIIVGAGGFGRDLYYIITESIGYNKEFKILGYIDDDLNTMNGFSDYPKLIGKISQEILESISEFQLDAYCNNLGYVSHTEALEHQRKSQVLLLIEIDSEETKSIIPGKLFEYMVSERPIIAIGPKDSDFAEIITSTNTGVFFTYSEKERLRNTILAYFELFLENKLQVHPVGLQQYSRKNLTEKLVSILNN